MSFCDRDGNERGMFVFSEGKQKDKRRERDRRGERGLLSRIHVRLTK